MKKEPLKKKTFEFALLIIDLCEELSEHKKKYVLSRQLMRSGTNPGAMLREAKKAESRADFIHKLASAQKEINESQYWLELLIETNLISLSQFERLYALSKEIDKMLASSILTSKQKIQIKK